MNASVRTTILVLAVLVPAGILGIGLARRLATPVEGSGAVPPQARAGVVATDQSMTSGKGVKIRFSDKPVAMPVASFTTLDGATIGPAEMAGKVVIVNFWATWCGPCRAEIPMLAALQERYRDKLVVLGLSIDEGKPDNVRAFAAQYQVNYPIAMVPPEVQTAFGGVPAIPLSFIVKPDAGIVQRHAGILEPSVTEHEVRALAGLPTEATVEVVNDTGQLLAANAAFAKEIPGLSFAGLSDRQKEDALRRLNSEKCACGCGLTLAQCRIQDPSCTVSPPLAQKVVDDIRRAGGQ
jgi:thiol-disulfide isomerase/thioredoxin